MVLAPALLHSSVVFAAASTSKSEERGRDRVIPRPWGGEKPLPFAEGSSGAHTLLLWQLLRFRGVLVLWEVHSWLGIWAAVKETSAGFVCSSNSAV